MKKEKGIKCPSCGAVNDEGLVSCKECGFDFSKISENDSKDCLGNITLTKDAVVMSASKIGKKYFMHMFLKNISSIQLHYKSRPVFLVLAIISLLLGIISMFDYSMQDFCVISFISWIVFTIIFFVTARHVLIITAFGGEKMTQCIGKGWNVEEFVQKIIQAQKDLI